MNAPNLEKMVQILRIFFRSTTSRKKTHVANGSDARCRPESKQIPGVKKWLNEKKCPTKKDHSE